MNTGHRAYIGVDKSGLVDTEPVLRHFGGNKKRAEEVYIQFVESGLGQQRQARFYQAIEGRLLGNEEFLNEVKHRISDHRKSPTAPERIDVDDLLSAATRCSGLSRQELCSRSKNRRAVAVREAVIVIGRERGITNRQLAEALGLDASAVTRRVEAARSRQNESPDVIALRKALGRKGG